MNQINIGKILKSLLQAGRLHLLLPMTARIFSKNFDSLVGYEVNLIVAHLVPELIHDAVEEGALLLAQKQIGGNLI